MAFIVTASVGASRGCPTSKQKCSSRPAALTIGIPSVAAAIISAALLSPMPLWALDGVLVFDHDQSLSGANFANRQDLKGAIFSKSNCKNATFAASNLTNAQLDDANVRSKLFAYFVVAFQGANFEGATAINVMATNTKFRKANLKNVDFTNANLISAIFDGADIEGADFSDSLIDRATTIKLCKTASGTNPKTGIPTAESLMCPE